MSGLGRTPPPSDFRGCISMLSELHVVVVDSDVSGAPPGRRGGAMFQPAMAPHPALSAGHPNAGCLLATTVITV